MTGDEERIDGRALLQLLLATPSGRIADALDRMSPEEQDALFGVFARAALVLEAQAGGLRRPRLVAGVRREADAVGIRAPAVADAADGTLCR
jgi:hypothetical protein